MNNRCKLLNSIMIVATSISVASMGGCSSGGRVEPSQSHSVVLLHGAHLTADSWADVERELSRSGAKVRALDLPGRNDLVEGREVTLDSSSRALCEQIKNEAGHLTLVAHSQAGAIVNHAFSQCPNVSIGKIIYIAAVVPGNGEKPFDKLSQEDEDTYMKSVAYDEPRNMMKIVDSDGFWRSFGIEEKNIDAVSLSELAVDEPASIAEGVVSMDEGEFSEPEKFYVFTKNDQIISFGSQKIIAKDLNLVSSEVLDSGHVPMLTDSKKLADTISKFIFDY